MASIAIVPAQLGSVEHVPGSKGYRLDGEDSSPPANGLFYGQSGGVKGWFAPPGASGGEEFTIYEIAEGFWAEGTAGIGVVKNSDGNFTITVPDGGHFKRIWKELITGPGDLDGAGALTLLMSRDNGTAEGGASTVNIARASAFFPIYWLIDSSGTQRNMGDVAVTSLTTVSAGTTTSVLTGINGLGLPVQIVIQ